MRNLRIITIVNALFYMGNGTGMAFVTLWLEALGASYGMISLIVALHIIASIAANTLYSRYADRLGARRRWLVAGLWLLAAGFALLALAPSLAQATAARLLEGVGIALFSTTSLALIGQLLKDSPTRGRSMGFIRGLGSLTFAFGSLGGGWLAQRYGINTAFYLGIGVYFLAGAVALLLAPSARPRPQLTSPLETLAEAARPLEGTPDGVARARLPWLFIGAVVAFMAAHTASATFFPNYLRSVNQNVDTIGQLWALTAALEFPSMMIMGSLADVWGRGLLLALGAFTVGGVNLLYVAAPRIPFGFIVAQMIRAPGLSSYWVNGMAYTAEQSTENDRVLNSGIFNMSQSAGQLLGVLVGGVVAQGLGFRTLYIAVGALFVGAGLAFLRLPRRAEVT